MLMLRHDEVGKEARQKAKFSIPEISHLILEHLDSVIVVGVNTNLAGDAK